MPPLARVPTALALAASLGVGTAPGLPARAASVGPDGALAVELDRLEGDFRATAGAVRLAQAQSPDVARQLASIVARLGQIEEELRRLRGRVDEVEFRQRRADDRAEVSPPTPATTPPPTTGGRESVQLPTVRPLPGGQAPGTLREPSLGVPGAPPVQAARVDPTAPAQQQYEAALQILQRGDWAGAEAAFDGFVRRFPQDPLAANASYWLAETHYIRKDYTGAAAVFARNYRAYGSDAPRAPDNLLKLGMSLAALGDRDRACQTFSELERRHDNAPTPIKQALVRERAAAGCG